VRIRTIRIVGGIWSVGREGWGVTLGPIGRRRRAACSTKGSWIREYKPWRVAENGPGCGRSGTCTVEAHILDSGVREVGEGSCGVRQGLALCTVRCRGSAWDRSATTISDEQAERLQREIWEVTRHSEWGMFIATAPTGDNNGCASFGFFSSWVLTRRICAELVKAK
jgi:hypothetical protein